MITPSVEILGVDCGNVIFRPFSGRQITGSILSLQKINQEKKFNQIFIISRAGLVHRIFFYLRLLSLNFWNTTGIPKENLYFCWRNKDKALLCKKLKVTHFIDDRLQVLSYLQDVKNLYALNPTNKEINSHPQTFKSVKTAKSWSELVTLLLGINT